MILADALIVPKYYCKAQGYLVKLKSRGGEGDDDGGEDSREAKRDSGGEAGQDRPQGRGGVAAGV